MSEGGREGGRERGREREGEGTMLILVESISCHGSMLIDH